MFTIFNIFLPLKYKYTIMCNYLNKYTNLNDTHYIRYTSLWNLYKKCIPYLSGIFSIKKKVTMVSKHTLIQISLYPWLTGKYILPYLSKQVFLLKFNAKKGGTILSPWTFQSGEGNCPQLFRPWSGICEVWTADSYGTSEFMSVRILGVFVLLNLQFSGYS